MALYGLATAASTAVRRTVRIHLGAASSWPFFSGHSHINYVPSTSVPSYEPTINFSTKSYPPNPLDAFRDPIDRQTRLTETVGRSWSAKELRRKSYQDLHKLWYILYKERNMLLTEQQLSRRRQLNFPQPDRFRKVQKSMGAIKQVLGERKRERVAEHLSRMEESMMEESESIDDGLDVQPKK